MAINMDAGDAAAARLSAAGGINAGRAGLRLFGYQQDVTRSLRYSRVARVLPGRTSGAAQEAL